MRKLITVLVTVSLFLSACANDNPFTDVEPGAISVTEVASASYDGTLLRLVTASSIAEQEDFPEAFRGPREVEGQILITWCDPGSFSLSDSYSNGDTLFLTLLREDGSGRCSLWSVPRAQLAGVSGIVIQDIDEQTLEVGYVFP